MLERSGSASHNGRLGAHAAATKLNPASPSSTPPIRARTDQDGAFKMSGILPGQYIVRVSTGTPPPPPAFDFTEADLDATDWDIVEDSYWPGVRDAAAAALVTVTSGVSLDLGTLRSRKGPLYRVRVSMPGCRPEDRPQFSALRSNGSPILFPVNAPHRIGSQLSIPSCQDFLIRNLAPGPCQFHLETQQGWALVPVDIKDKNLTVSLAVTPDSPISGRVIMADDAAPLPPLDRVKIGLMPIGQIPAWGVSNASPRPDGVFAFNTVRWPRHNVFVAGLSRGYYIQELRVNGVPSPDRLITVGPGSQLEVVLDNQPATLAGTVTDGEKPAIRPRIYATKWPMDSPGQLAHAQADSEGRFRLAGLPPGTYRVLAVSAGTLADALELGDPLPQVWDQADTVTLERGKVKDIALKLVGSSR